MNRSFIYPILIIGFFSFQYCVSIKAQLKEEDRDTAEIESEDQVQEDKQITDDITSDVVEEELVLEDCPTWSKTYGGESSDNALSIIQADDGGYILTGSTESFGAQYSDIIVIKLDLCGNLQWQRLYGGERYDAGIQIIQTTDDGYLIAAQSDSFSSREWKWDYYVIKISKEGDIEWEKTYGGEGQDILRSIVQTKDGGFLLAGVTDSFGAGNYDTYIIKIDNQGTIKWVKTYIYSDFGIGNDEVFTVVESLDGNYVLAGGMSYDIYAYELWIFKIDKDGNKLWENKFFKPNEYVATSIINIKDGGFIITGYWENDASTRQAIVLKLDSNGKEVWFFTCPTIRGGSGWEIVETKDNCYVLIGGAKFPGDGIAQLYIAKISSEGNLVWEYYHGGIYFEQGRAIVQIDDNGFVVAGCSYSFGRQKVKDIWVLKLDSGGNANYK